MGTNKVLAVDAGGRRVTKHGYGGSALSAEASISPRGEAIALAINRVLEAALIADTAEDLGRVCLDIALDLTRSGYGFLGSLDHDEVIHDVVISSRGVDVCDMPERVGHQTRRFPVTGLYGHVINTCAPYMTNDPAHDGQATGTPRGHPPLTSFLGVPLLREGRSVGMIAVANREGGYKQADAELLTAIAPAVETAIERRRSADDLRDTAKQLGAHVENSPLAVIRFDPEFRVVSWSPGAERVFGYREAEIVGKAIAEMRWVYEDDVPLVEAESRGFLDGSRPQSVNTNRNYRKDGAVIWCEWYSSAIYADDGTLESVLSLVLDVTERKRAEQEVGEAKDHFELLSLTTNLLLTNEEPVAIIQRIAERVMEHLGCGVFFNYIYEAPHMLRLNAWGGIDDETAETIRWLEEGQAVCGCVARDGLPIVAPDVQDVLDPRLDLVRGMGVTAYACMPLVVGGETFGTLSFGARDRTSFSDEHLALMRTVAEQVSVALERRQNKVAMEESEGRFRSVLENALDAAYRRDLVADRYDYMSPVIETITGFPADEFAALPMNEVLDRIHPEDRSHVLERIAEGEQTGSLTCDYRFMRKDGRYIWMSDTAKVTRDADGRALYRSGIVRDSTELMEAMRELKAAQQRQSFLLRLSDRLAPLKDAVEVQLAAAQAIAEHLGADRAYYTMVDNDAGYAMVDAEYTRPGVSRLMGLYQFDEFAESMARLDKGTLVIDDSATHPSLQAEESENFRLLGIGAQISVPLHKNGRLVAIFTVNQRDPRQWSEGEITLVEEVAARTWAADARARTECELRQSLARTTVLKEIAAAVASSLDAVRLADRVLSVVREFQRADVGIVYLLDDPQGPAVAVSHFGVDLVDPLRTLDVDETTLGGLAMVTKRIQAAGEKPLPAGSRERERLAGMAEHRWIAAPLVVHGRCIGVMKLAYESRRQFTEEEVAMVEAVANQLSIGLDKARLYQAEHDIAETLQETLVVLPRHVPGLEFSRAYESATYEAGRVGGDFIDVFGVHGNVVGITLGDISGKGIDAAVTTALVRTTLRVHAVDGLPPADVVRKANQVMRRFTEADAFATLWFGLLNVRSGVLRYVCAGHPPAIILPAKGEPSELVCKDPILGAFDEAMFYENQTIMIPGDRLLMYSDGATEARTPDGEFMGSAGFMELVRAHRDTPASELAPAIMAELREFSAGLLRDDVALLAVAPSRLKRLAEDANLISFDFE